MLFHGASVWTKASGVFLLAASSAAVVIFKQYFN
jgi:hypothetical protein